MLTVVRMNKINTIAILKAPKIIVLVESDLVSLENLAISQHLERNKEKKKQKTLLERCQLEISQKTNDK